MRAFSAFFKGIQLVYEDLFFMVGISLIWTVAALPAYLFGYWIYISRGNLATTTFFTVLTVLIVPLLLGPASMGVFRVTYELANERRADMSLFWEAVRHDFKASWRATVATLAIMALLVAEISASINLPGVLRYVTLLWLYALLTWLAAQLYYFPFLMAQKEPRTWWAIRNSALTALANPIFSLVLLLLIGIVTVVSVVFPILLVLIWPAAMGMITNRGLAMILEKLPKTESAENSDATKE